MSALSITTAPATLAPAVQGALNAFVARAATKAGHDATLLEAVKMALAKFLTSPEAQAAGLEVLTWNRVGSSPLPADNRTVLLTLEGDDERTWLGFLGEDEHWHCVSGHRIDGRVVAWAEQPQGVWA